MPNSSSSTTSVSSASSVSSPASASSSASVSSTTSVSSPASTSSASSNHAYTYYPRLRKFAINLEGSKDRLEDLQSQIGDDLEVFKGIYGVYISSYDLFKYFNVRKARKAYQCILTKPQIGCTLSHFEVYKKVVADSSIKENEWVLICEDDIKFDPDFRVKVDRILAELDNPRYENLDLVILKHLNTIQPEDFTPYTKFISHKKKTIGLEDPGVCKHNIDEILNLKLYSRMIPLKRPIGCFKYEDLPSWHTTAFQQIEQEHLAKMRAEKAHQDQQTPQQNQAENLEACKQVLRQNFEECWGWKNPDLHVKYPLIFGLDTPQDYQEYFATPEGKQVLSDYQETKIYPPLDFTKAHYTSQGDLYLTPFQYVIIINNQIPIEVFQHKDSYTKSFDLIKFRSILQTKKELDLYHQSWLRHFPKVFPLDYATNLEVDYHADYKYTYDINNYPIYNGAIDSINNYDKSVQKLVVCSRLCPCTTACYLIRKSRLIKIVKRNPTPWWIADDFKKIIPLTRIALCVPSLVFSSENSYNSTIEDNTTLTNYLFAKIVRIVDELRSNAYGSCNILGLSLYSKKPWARKLSAKLQTLLGLNF